MAATTDKTELKYAAVKVGDRVWLCSDYGRNPRGGGMKKVMATTAAFIYLEGNKEFNTYKRDGNRYGRHLHGYITSVATPQEIAEWDAERARDEEKQREHEAERLRIEGKHVELKGLFSGEGVAVADAAWGTQEDRKGKFDVTFHGLTEAQVRELAKKLEGK